MTESRPAPAVRRPVDLVVFVLRVALGVMMLYAGIVKMGHVAEFAGQIAGFQILPQALDAPFGLLLPFVEAGAGLYLIVGLFTRYAALFTAVEFVVFSLAIASAVMRGISTSCGCFGPNDHTMTSWPEVARDAGFAVWALVVAWRAPGTFSLDARMRTTS